MTQVDRSHDVKRSGSNGKSVEFLAGATASLSFQNATFSLDGLYSVLTAL